MAYDEILADRIRAVVPPINGLSEKQMFGGWCLLVHGQMSVGIVKDELMVRLAPETAEAMLERPHTRPMDFTGRPLKGYLYVEPAGLRSEKALREWVAMGVDFAAALPAKKPKAKSAKKKHPPKAQGIRRPVTRVLPPCPARGDRIRWR
jgi:TfoX/Sxy family transcriptional regulator of competence genes